MYTEEEIIDLYHNKKIGMSRIYELTGCSSNTTRRILNKHNIRVRQRNETREVDLEKEELFDLYWNKDLSINKIAKIKNVSPTTISRLLTKYDIARKEKFWTSDKIEKCKTLLETRKSYKNVAETMAVSTSAIENLNRDKIGHKMSLWASRDEEEIKKFLIETKDYQQTASRFNIELSHLVDRNNKKWHIDLSANSTKFGTPTDYNGILYRSQKEAEIAKYLTEQKVEFEYEKRVNDIDTWTCDFYLCDYNIWLEYDGLGDDRIGHNYRTHPKIDFYRQHKYSFFILHKNKWKSQLISILRLLQKEKPSFDVRIIDRKQADSLLSYYHYLGGAQKGDQLFYGLFIGDFLVGCCTFGKGSNRFLSSGVGGEALELTRLYTLDWLPRNSISYFLSKVIKSVKIVKPNIQYLVSFADPNVGHTGSVYKACNWVYTGKTQKDYMYCLPDGKLVHKSNFRCKNGKTEKQLAAEGRAIKIPRLGKHRYTYKLF